MHLRLGEGVILPTIPFPGTHINPLGLEPVHSSFPAQLVVYTIFLPSFLFFPLFTFLSEVFIHNCILFIFVSLTPSTVLGTS